MSTVPKTRAGMLADVERDVTCMLERPERAGSAEERLLGILGAPVTATARQALGDILSAAQTALVRAIHGGKGA
jgi:hypothetical protein